MELQVKPKGSGKCLLIVIFEQCSNFWIEPNGKATWAFREKELWDILEAYQVINEGNKQMKKDREKRKDGPPKFYS